VTHSLIAIAFVVGCIWIARSASEVALRRSTELALALAVIVVALQIFLGPSA
jgi:hypothetical protein